MDSPFRQDPGDPSIQRHANVHCPACGYRVDSASAPGDGPAPQPVSGGICFRCGDVNVYEVGAFGVALRAADVDEVAQFAADPANTLIVRQVHRFWAQRGGSQR